MGDWKMKFLLTILAVFLGITCYAQFVTGVVKDQHGIPLKAMIFVEGSSENTETDEEGFFKLQVSPGTYDLVAFVPDFAAQKKQITISGSIVSVEFALEPLSASLEEIMITDSRTEVMGLTWLKSVSGSAIYEGKKSELIQVDQIVGNKAANVGRQVYARVPGLNIWENDGAGIQLGIGGRGLNPNRTSNFNVRQNGYDISADALGYPESYYTPPIQALKRIEIVRGAAGLQYGTQFGGLLNFVFNEGPKNKVIDVNLINTAGSFGFFNSFNSIGGQIGKLNYYGFYQYRRTNGWRPNSGLSQHVGYGAIKYDFNPFLSIKVENTYMTYLAQQPGGLTDNEFNRDPKQSNRDRNWFDVGWNVTAVEVDYRINSSIRVNNRTFFLDANRYAVGNLGRIDRPDDFGNRDLLKDEYKNWGNELRTIIHYDFFGDKSVLLLGNRVYFGQTFRGQGESDNGSKANFAFLNPERPEDSDFEFPGRNISFFAENIFNIGYGFSITPGMRYEFIQTDAEGYYVDRRTDLAGNVLFEEQIPETRKNGRSLVLGGVGLSYKVTDQMELYANVSQNFRAINFNDIRVVNPSFLVDSLIQDERGYNLDLGIRGGDHGKFRYDISGFYLSYKDKIGSILTSSPDPRFNNLIERTYRLRTNVADASIVGLEFFGELDWWSLMAAENSDIGLITFMNLSWIASKYDESAENGIAGNEVELVPPINLKTGITFKKNQLGISTMYTYVAKHFSDASNATFSPTAVEGVIPSYGVMDLSISYSIRNIKVESGINNLTDERYFTRRAAGYPGPGIIPSDARSFYVTMGFNF